MVCCSKTFTKTYLIAIQNVIFINKAQQPIVQEKMREFTKTAVDCYVARVVWIFYSLDLGTGDITPLDHSSVYI